MEGWWWGGGALQSMGLTGEPAVAATLSSAGRVCLCVVCLTMCVCVRVCVCMGECARARSSACEGVTECSGVCVHLYSRWMCVKLFLVLMYVFTVLLLCFSDCHESTCAF